MDLSLLRESLGDVLEKNIGSYDLEGIYPAKIHSPNGAEIQITGENRFKLFIICSASYGVNVKYTGPRTVSEYLSYFEHGDSRKKITAAYMLAATLEGAFAEEIKRIGMMENRQLGRQKTPRLTELVEPENLRTMGLIGMQSDGKTIGYLRIMRDAGYDFNKAWPSKISPKHPLMNFEVLSSVAGMNKDGVVSVDVPFQLYASFKKSLRRSA
ncbi:MAG: hypothetical protein ACE5FT_00260 [Candidatus Nanoarchaeia archaeon]